MLAHDAAPVPPPPATQLDAASSQPVKSIVELGRMFALLDGSMRSGKSSVLERLMMTPLLPRAENT